MARCVKILCLGCGQDDLGTDLVAAFSRCANGQGGVVDRLQGWKSSSRSEANQIVARLRLVQLTLLAGSVPGGGAGGTIKPRPCSSRTVRCAAPRQTS